MREIGLINESARSRFFKIIHPVGNFFSRIGVHPMIVSYLGLVLSVVAGIMYGMGLIFWAAWVVVLAGCCDVLDGYLARAMGKESTLGAFLDSTLDRYSDFFIFLGLGWLVAGGPSLLDEALIHELHSPWGLLFTVFALIGSFMVSYTRARAESLGVDCTVGLMQRPERVILLIIGSLLGALPVVGPTLLHITILVLAVGSNVTALHRIIHVRKQLLGRSPS